MKTKRTLVTLVAMLVVLLNINPTFSAIPSSLNYQGQLTESEVDAAVANNGYSTGAHTLDTNAGTVYHNNTSLNGDGTCDPVPVQYPEVNYTGRLNTSSSPVFFDEANHHLFVTYTGGANDFTIVSDNGSIGKYVIIDDGTDVTTAGAVSTVDASITKNISISKVAAIDIHEPLNNDRMYRYRYMVTDSANLVACTREIY